jgi:hypothetical protein
VTYYTLFALDLKSRRVQIVVSTPEPDAAFMAQERAGSRTPSMGSWRATGSCCATGTVSGRRASEISWKERGCASC